MAREPITPIVGRRLPSLNALRVFEAAARLGSFKRAAEELRVTQSAVSRQIRTLEAQLGVTLFRRLNRLVELTEAGEALLPTMSRVLVEIAEVTSLIAGGASPARGRTPLVIAASPGVAELWLGCRLGGFCRANPDVEPEIIVARDLRPLLAGIADVTIYWGAGAWPNLHHEVLCELTEFPVCSRSLLERGPPLRSLADLRRHRLLHWESRALWGAWLRAFGVEGVDWQSGPLLHDYSLYLEMTAAGEGVALVDDLMAAEHVRTGRLVKPLAAVRTPLHRQHLLMRPDARRPEAVAAFRDWIVAEIVADRLATEAIRKPEPYGLASVPV